jgi:fatty-acyl-CoA synthase
MTMQKTPLLMHRLLDRGAKVSPEVEVVTKTAEGSHRQTLAATRGRACQLAHALAADGIGEGDRVASFAWNNHFHLEMYQAVPSMGAVLHTLNIRLSPGELEYIINHAGDRVIVCDQDVLPLLEPLVGKIPSVERVVVCAEPGAGDWETALPGAVDYDAFIAEHAAEYDWPELDEHAPMGLCYTSGTTGMPKGVMYTHRSTYLHTMAQAMTDAMALSATDCVQEIVPMFHAMSWGMPFTALMLGCKQVLPHRFMTPEGLLDVMSEEGVTISAGVPTIWQGAMSAITAEPDRWDLSRLSRVTCGGSAPPPALIQGFWDRLDCEMIQGWGMTETNPLAALSRRVGKRGHLTSSDETLTANQCKAGLTLPGLEIEVFDASWNPLPHDGASVGEVCIRGPWICSEYYNDPQPDKFHGDWLVTGDVGMIDAEEYLILTDRSKDLIKSGGEWISSIDLENHICALEGVAQAAVVAAPHPKWDERPVAIVVVSADHAPKPVEILDHCSGRFAKWQLPDEVLFREEIPLTSTGKIDKKTIRASLDAEGYRLPDLRD